jgi:hypothetical protein
MRIRSAETVTWVQEPEFACHSRILAVLRNAGQREHFSSLHGAFYKMLSALLIFLWLSYSLFLEV